jgi:cellulose biosynthesis protein BcsQ
MVGKTALTVTLTEFFVIEYDKNVLIIDADPLKPWIRGSGFRKPR